MISLSNVNKTRPLDGTWQRQMQQAVRTAEELALKFPLTTAERAGAVHAQRHGFPISITPYYASLIDWNDPLCPIRLQSVPRRAETQAVPGDLRDPLGEEDHEVAPHLIQRYPDRALLLVTDRCSMYCRFCTRSRMVGQGGGARALTKLEPAFAYIRANDALREVIVSGGDPALMATSKLTAIISRLAAIRRIDTVRLATRAPVTLPQRIDRDFARALAAAHPALWVMTHFNHPRELTSASRAALAHLVDAGLPVMNQTVLLRHVNDDAATLERLFRGLVRERVRPYYLLQADPVIGTGHLRTPLSTGLEIMRALQGRISGIALPRFVVDTPGGRGKVPLLPSYLHQQIDGIATLETFRGEKVTYIDPPVEGRLNKLP